MEVHMIGVPAAAFSSTLQDITLGRDADDIQLIKLKLEPAFDITGTIRYPGAQLVQLN